MVQAEAFTILCSCLVLVGGVGAGSSPRLESLNPPLCKHTSNLHACPAMVP